MSVAELLRTRIEELAQEPLTTSRQIAAQIDPSIWSEWDAAFLDSVHVRYVGDVLRAVRRAMTYALEQGEIAEAIAEGRSIFGVSFVVTEEGHRKNLGDMTGPDHKFVAQGYRDTARQAQAAADLHDLIAKKVGRQLTSQVFTEEQLRSLFDRFGG